MEKQETTERAFTSFMEDTQRKVLIALAASFGPDAANDATAEAFAYAWEHWDRVSEMENPAGYVYRVGRSRIPRRRVPAVCHRRRRTPHRWWSRVSSRPSVGCHRANER